VTELLARLLYFLRVEPNVSTGICGSLTFGYGHLDHNGYWKFQVPALKLRTEHKELLDAD
jgi:hypothetical protein